ncbi:MAG: branched-chain amino acid ABC transporter permease [Myxococcales bacterium]
MSDGRPTRRGGGHTLAAIVAILAVAAVYPLVLPGSLNFGFSLVLFAALATAWDLIGGWAGQLSLGHTAFIGIGAYVSTLLWTKAGLGMGVGLPVAVLAGVLVALVWGSITFRLRGAYFSLASISVAEVLRILANNWSSFTGGPEGVSYNDLPPLFGLDLFDRRVEYYGALILLALALFCAQWVGRSRLGFFLAAVREDQDSSMALAVNPLKMKLIAFTLSAALTTAGGCLYALYLSFFEPHGVFNFDLSLALVLMSIVGGMGTVLGPILGALVLLSVQEGFRNVFQQSSLLIYGVLIVIMVRFAPDGLSGRLQLLFRRIPWPSRSPSAR